MRYLLDTCVISDFIKGEPGTFQRFKQVSPTNLAVSAITEMELRCGLACNPRVTENKREAIIDTLASMTTSLQQSNSRTSR